MKRVILHTAIAVFLLSAGLAAGFATGQSMGFSKGSEWAIMQAGIIAEEAGEFMPVSYEDGSFRVVIQQPRGLYRQAQRVAAMDHNEAQYLLIKELAPREESARKDRL